MLKIRPAEPREIPRLQEIEKAARCRYRSAGRLSFAADKPPIASNRLSEGDVVVAEEADRAIGFILMSRMDDMLYIANISVDFYSSGRGIGAALIDAAEHHARSCGLTALTLATFRTPRWNAPWFRQLGFRRMPADRIGPSLRAILARYQTFLDMRTRMTMWRPL